MKVAIYSRYSTDAQDVTSIDGQVANAEALAARESLDVVARYQDEGQSGNDDQRPGYQAMLAAAKRGDFTGIVCDETSRITRNQAELHRLVAELRFRDRFLLSCDGIDTREETSEILLSVKAAIDAMESRKIATRTFRGLRERHKNGHSAGGRVYGYTSVEDGDYRRRVIDPEQAEVIREIFERYAAGESAKVIAGDLNRRGIKSPGAYWNVKVRRANGWAHTTILGSHTKASGILRNSTYVGRPVWNRRKAKKVPGTAMRLMCRRPDAEWIEVADESLRIITDAQWNRVQARLTATRAKAHPNNKGGRPARYLLSGLLTCSSCGGHYVVRDGRAYSCSSHSNGRTSFCAQRRSLKRDGVEKTLLAGVKAEFTPKVIKEMVKHVQVRLRQIKQPDRTGLKIDLKRLEQQIENVVDTLTAIGRSDALTARLRHLEADKAAICAKVAYEPEPPRIFPDVEKRVRQLVQNLELLPENPHRDAALMDKARAALRGLLGPVTIVEEEGAVFADVEMGRACITDGSGGRI